MNDHITSSSLPSPSSPITPHASHLKRSAPWIHSVFKLELAHTWQYAASACRTLAPDLLVPLAPKRRLAGHRAAALWNTLNSILQVQKNRTVFKRARLLLTPLICSITNLMTTTGSSSSNAHHGQLVRTNTLDVLKVVTLGPQTRSCICSESGTCTQALYPHHRLSASRWADRC